MSKFYYSQQFTLNYIFVMFIVTPSDCTFRLYVILSAMKRKTRIVRLEIEKVLQNRN